jgi:hypothetical protein
MNRKGYGRTLTWGTILEFVSRYWVKPGITAVRRADIRTEITLPSRKPAGKHNVRSWCFFFPPEGGVGLVPKRGCLHITHSPDDMSLKSDGGMILTGENRWTRWKTCPSATLSTTNPTWIDPGANPDLRGERPATNDLSHGTALLGVRFILSVSLHSVSQYDAEKWQCNFIFLVRNFAKFWLDETGRAGVLSYR